MMEKEAFGNLVSQARQGDERAKDALVRAVQPGLRAYIYRVTLDEDLTQDLTQEGLLEMVRSIGGLRKIGSFWPWLYGVAQSKIRQHYRYKQRKAAVSASVLYGDFLAQQADRREDDGLRRLLREELSKTVMTAMRGVKHEYRAVLALRCFDRLSYADIGAVMECSEIRARVLFFRARQALKGQLTRRGISKTLLVMCLGLFGKLTAPAEAASSAGAVTAASTKVGVSTLLMAAASTKVGIATIAAAVALAGVGSVAVFSEPGLPGRSEVSSFHYTVQARNYDGVGSSSLSKGAYEQRYYFPEGVDGPVFMRMQRWSSDLRRKQCAWLQNDEGNYYYYAGELDPANPAKVHINNYRLWLSSLRVRRLPTDSVGLTNFLNQVEGTEGGVKYSRDGGSGLLTGAVDYRFADARGFRTKYEYNTLDAGEFEHNWPADFAVLDERDRMHGRGWTYFRIIGRVRDQTVSGLGRIPFVYTWFKQSPPWLKMNLGEVVQILDSAKGSCLRRSDGTLVAVYGTGAFLKGLSRPWMGMHTVDIVRRDAAEQRMWFDTELGPDEKSVYVTVAAEAGGSRTELLYRIALEDDIVEGIELAVDNRRVGELKFAYLQDIDSAGDEFKAPEFSADGVVDRREAPGISWLIDLAQGRLAD